MNEMKIKVKAMVIKEIEVDDKFNVLALDDPNYLSYPTSNTLHDELAIEMEKATGFSSKWNNNDFSIPKIMEVLRLPDESLILQA
jgi:hypothetical protein